MAASNLVNAEQVSKTYGTRTILDQVSLGLGKGDVIGVVGRNGDGKSTLLKLLTGAIEPDAGRVTRTGSVSVGVLTQAERVREGETVRDLIVAGDTLRDLGARTCPLSSAAASPSRAPTLPSATTTTSGPATPTAAPWWSTCSPTSTWTPSCPGSPVASDAAPGWSA